jgi:hypothetical protein
MAKNDKSTDKDTTPAAAAATAPTVEELQAQLAALQSENEELKKQVLSPEEESIVKFKIRAGLSREQALEVIKAQKEWDADPTNPKNLPPPQPLNPSAAPASAKK